MAKLTTRRKIMSAAELLFSQNGYDGVPTKLIASEAGVTEATLFNHFKNKKLLYTTVVKEKYLAMDSEMIFSDLTYDDLEKDLMTISGKLVKNYLGNKNVLMMRMKEKQSFQDDDSFALKQDPVLKRLTPVLKLYEGKGCLKDTGEASALIFMAAIKGLFYIAIMEDKTEDALEEMISQYVKMACYGLLK